MPSLPGVKVGFWVNALKPGWRAPTLSESSDGEDALFRKLA